MVDGDRLFLLVNRVMKEIPLAELIYAEAHNREISFHVTDKEIQGYYCMAELQKELPSNFYRCHRSFIVNLDYVDYVEGSDIRMKNGERIPLPKKRRAAFMERLTGKTIRE